MLVKYNIYKLSGRTPHSFLGSSQQGVNVNGFLVTTHEVAGVTKYKEKNIDLNQGEMSFYVKVAFCSTGRKKFGISTGSKFKNLTIDDVFVKLQERCGIDLEVHQSNFLLKPDVIHGEAIRNAFEIYGMVKSIKDKEKLLDVLNNGVGNRKSYGFGQIVLFNLKDI